jgi:hypothetical protein
VLTGAGALALVAALTGASLRERGAASP